MDRDCISVQKHAKKEELGEYPATLTGHLVNKPYIQQHGERHCGSVFPMNMTQPWQALHTEVLI